MVKYFFELILEDELYDLKRENKVKETLIEIANEEISNLAKENQHKNKTIADCNEEILKEIKINRELLGEKKKLTIELDETQHAFKIEHDKCKSLDAKNHKLEKELDNALTDLENEKKKMAELVKINKKLEATFDELKTRADKFEALSRELTCTLQARDSEILRINAELKVQKDHVEDIQMKMKYLKDDLAVAEDKYLSEKQYKIKIEKQKDILSNQLLEVKLNLEKSEQKTREALEQKRNAESEISKLKIDLEEEKREHEAHFNLLKKRHDDSVDEMSRQIQALFVAKTKLEKERLEQSKLYEAPKLNHNESVAVESPLTLEEKLAYESKRTSSLRQRLRRVSTTTKSTTHLERW